MAGQFPNTEAHFWTGAVSVSYDKPPDRQVVSERQVALIWVPSEWKLAIKIINSYLACTYALLLKS